MMSDISADYGIMADVTYKENVPGEYFRNYRFMYSHHLRWNFDRATINRDQQFRISVLFPNYYETVLEFGYQLPACDDRESRGFGLYRTPRRFTTEFYVDTDYREKIIGVFAQQHVYDDAGRRQWTAEGKLILRPTSSVEFQFQLGYSRTRNLEGYVNTVTDITGTDISIFGRRDVDQYDLTLRGSLVFTQTLTLQIYNQLFTAQGRYYNFSKLGYSGELHSYPYIGNDDFNETSLNTNVVLRWEYLPGSTLFAVWSHGRQFSEPGGFQRTYADEWNNTFTVRPDNVFLLKITYWWSM
jgi:hypothetical protein